MTPERKVGAVAAAALVVLLAGVFLIGRVNFMVSGYRIKAQFRFVNDLKASAAVKYAGGPVIGRVEKLYVENEMVNAVLFIDRKVRIRKDCEIWIFSAGMLGEQYVEINASPGGSAPFLENGAVVRGVDPESLDSTFIKLGKIVDAVAPVFGRDDMSSSIRSLMTDLRYSARRISQAVAKHADGLEGALSDVEAFSRNLNRMSKDFETIMTNVKDLSDPKSPESVHQAVKKLNAAMSSFQETSLAVESLAKKIDQGKGVLGALVNDEQLAKDLRELVKKLKDKPITAKIRLF